MDNLKGLNFTANRTPKLQNTPCHVHLPTPHTHLDEKEKLQHHTEQEVRNESAHFLAQQKARSLQSSNDSIHSIHSAPLAKTTSPVSHPIYILVLGTFHNFQKCTSEVKGAENAVKILVPLEGWESEYGCI